MRWESNNHLQSSIDDLQAQIAAAAAQLKVVAKEAAGTAARKASDAGRASAEEAMGLRDKIIEEASDFASAAYDAAAKEAASGYRKAGSFVGRNPATVLATAFVLGVMFGLFNRKRSP